MSEKELTGIAKLLAEAMDRAEEREMQPLKKHWNQLRSQAATENSEGEQEPTASEREPHYLIKDKNGSLVSVPESKLDDWKQAQNERSEMSEELK